MNISNELIQYIDSLKLPAVIGVSGFGGSGKTTFATLLGKAIDAPVIGIDSFMVTVQNRNLHQYSIDTLIDFHRLGQEIITPFRKGKNPISYGHFDWVTNTIAAVVRVKHTGRIIVEGIWLFRPELMKYFDYTVWIDCPIDEAVRRGKKRDREVHKNPQDEHWDTFWKIKDLEYFQKFQPEKLVDMIIENK